ncbi:hypothetical protein GOBAR_AA04610 [Gossypium barbadense]|uniref:Uncharacterized protein n=1 Tax=Gossypium barbadense TaxID=3634 RepID=A0A2P5YKB1_GOSBA|nr:hypothetical protein GOBAR_AA04610 [Gossypium barbadense]
MEHRQQVLFEKEKQKKVPSSLTTTTNRVPLIGQAPAMMMLHREVRGSSLPAAKKNGLKGNSYSDNKEAAVRETGAMGLCVSDSCYRIIEVTKKPEKLVIRWLLVNHETTIEVREKIDELFHDLVNVVKECLNQKVGEGTGRFRKKLQLPNANTVTT